MGKSTLSMVILLLFGLLRRTTKRTSPRHSSKTKWHCVTHFRFSIHWAQEKWRHSKWWLQFRLFFSPYIGDWTDRYHSSMSLKKSTSENRSMLTQFNRWIGGGSWESHQGLMVKQSCIIPERACSRSMLDWYFMGMGQNDLSPKIITSDSFWDVQEGYSIFFLPMRMTKKKMW